MKRTYKIIIIIIEITFTYLIFIKKISIPCASKKLFNISCPACGLTRAFKSLLKFDIKSAIEYNFLIIPVIMFLVTMNIFLIYDIITNKDKTKSLFMSIGKYYILIFILLIISGIINNIKGI